MIKETKTEKSTVKKTSKRPKVRLKKQVRRTLGGLALASAIVVAAIPTGSYSGGEAEAAVTINSDGSKTLTHTVQTAYRGDTSSEHNEKYGPAFTETTYGKTFFSNGNNIPSCNAGETGGVPNTTIYSTGDGDFQFAYVDSTGNQTGSGTKTAIILGYNHQGSLAGGLLTIPGSVDAYLNFNDNDGSGTGFCSVGKSGNFLFYESEISKERATSLYYYVDPVKVTKTDSNGKLMYNIYVRTQVTDPWPTEPSLKDVNEDGVNDYRTSGSLGAEYDATDSNPNGLWKAEVIYVDQFHNFLPCYYATIDKWGSGTLYYYETSDFRPSGTPTTSDSSHYDNATPKHLIPQVADINDSAYGRISGAMVTAIGKQYLVDDGNNGWKIAGDIDETNGTSKGVFANNSYVTTLEIGNDLTGIGDYAFYGCTNMDKIITGNGLNTLGNHAFDNCRNMKTVNIPLACNLNTIGAYCFKNCQALQTFTLPTSVTTIGDGAFKSCWALTSIDFGVGGDSNGSLANIGVFAFNDCQKLRCLEFPQGYSQTILVSAFEGCKSLEYISALNANFNIVADPAICDYGWEEFKIDQDEGSTIKDKFYIECPSTATLHKTCTDNEVSYKYPNQDVYELTKKEAGIAGTSPLPTVTYQVNSSNILTDTKFNGVATSLNFPAYIGPYHIEEIGDYAFQDQCSLTEVNIASTINKIGTGAFMGCHNLKYVYFTNESVIIGDNAFQTQEVSTHSGNCVTSHYDGNDTNGKHIDLYPKSGMTDSNNKPVVELGFVGPIDVDSTPYKYAMSYEGRYNGNSQTFSFIKYYSGWPTMLTVRYNMTDTVTHEGYSELIDFPTAETLSSYASAAYLTTDQQTAANKAIADKAAGIPLTEAAQIFTDSANQLTVPTGIDAIEDGLFARLTAPAAVTTMDVVLQGIDHIEFGNGLTQDTDGSLYYMDDSTTPATKVTVVDASGNVVNATDATKKSDFYGCTKLGNLTLSGKNGAPNTKTLDPYAFADCSALPTVTVDCPINDVGRRAFYNDDALTDVAFSGTINSIGDEAFAEGANLATFAATDTIGTVGDHVFLNDPLLADVSFAAEINDLGVRPWGGCEKLSEIDFGNGTNYVCDNSIVYEVEGGVKKAIVELLEGRTSKVSGKYDDIAAVITLNDEGFKGSKVQSIDLSESQINKIPEDSFGDTKNLREVVLPYAKNVSNVILEKNAFKGSTLAEITGESNISPDFPDALDGIDTGSGHLTDSTDHTYNNKVTVYCPDGSQLHTYATRYEYKIEAVKEITYWTVTFQDWDATLGKNTTVATFNVANGEGVDPRDIPTPAGKEGLVFDDWYSSTDSTLTEVYENTIFTANYIQDSTAYTVTFKDYDGAVYKTYNIPQGKTLADNNIEIANLTLPDVTVGGVLMSHNGWLADGEITVDDPITRNVTFNPLYSLANGPFNIYMQYIHPTTAETVIYKTIKDVAKGTDVSGEIATTAAPSISGYTFNGWSKAGLSPSSADLTNVTTDIYLTGTFYSGGGGGGNGGGNSNVDPGTIDLENDEDVKAGNAFIAYYYYPNGIDLVAKIKIAKGDAAPNIAKPEAYSKGYKWDPDPTATKMEANHSFYLIATDEVNDKDTYTATYYYTDGVSVYQTLEIEKDGTPPNLMMPAGYYHCAWSPDPSSIKMDKDLRFTMVAGPNYDPTANNGGTIGDYYTCTVVNGSGSGTYAAGSQVIIVADEAPDGKQFGSWTISPDNAKIASKGLSATVITMPSENVTVTANYVTKTNGGNNNNGNNNGNNGGTTPTNTKTSSGTTVVIDKNGLSNTGVVSATVNGSSDNFTIKITESAAASEAVLKALIAEYGSIDNIIYFPMDISLYDASGEKKITDTTGLTVTITLPLPDSLQQYGGNNKVAGVVTNQLDVLAPKFTTIQGVPCVTFTCTHFSPYVIYVNTKNITTLGDNGGPADNTPKTGDGIKPKWFLSIGLAALGVFLFLWNGNRKKKVPVKA